MQDRKLPAVPEDWENYLTDDQKWALNTAQLFGVELFFIRRPENQHATVVVSQDNGKTAILMPDGSFDYDHILKIRQ